MLPWFSLACLDHVEAVLRGGRKKSASAETLS
jgi:hypothetical protein